MSADLSIVICTYNRLDCLRDAVASVIAQLPTDGTAELLIINDGATDGTAAWLDAAQAEWPASVQAIHQENQGLGAARNTGWRSARGKWIAYLDDDAIAPVGWLNHWLRICRESATDVATLGGPIRLKWEQPRPNWLPASLEEWLTCFEPGTQAFTSSKEPLFRGANMICRVEALGKVDGFSTKLGRKGGNLLSREECDLAEKLAAAGFVSRYEPAPWVWHRVHAERLNRRWFFRRLYWEGISLQVSNAHLATLPLWRRKARALLYAKKTLLRPSILFRTLLFNRPKTQIEAVGQLCFHLGFVQGIWSASSNL